MSDRIRITAELTVAQALELADKLRLHAELVKQHQNTGHPDAYGWLGQDALANNELRIRIGD